MNDTISLADLERYEQVLSDIKKVILFNKHIQKWFWVDKDCVNNLQEYHGPHETRLDALLDATEPYFEDSGT